MRRAWWGLLAAGTSKRRGLAKGIMANPSVPAAPSFRNSRRVISVIGSATCSTPTVFRAQLRLKCPAGMNEFFESLGRRWRAAAERRGARIEAPALDAKVALELLELARVAAHTKERRFAPLASYTAGVAAERLRVAKGADD